MGVLERLREYLPKGYVKEQRYLPRERVRSKNLPIGIYILSDGAVELCVKAKAMKRTLDIMLPGDTFGVLSNTKTAKEFMIHALTPVSFFHIDADNIERLGYEDPELILDIFSLVISKQAHIYEVLTNLCFFKAENKIRNVLNLLSKAAEERKTYLVIKKKHIAGITGISYENVVRTMSKMENLKSRRVRLW